MINEVKGREYKTWTSSKISSGLISIIRSVNFILYPDYLALSVRTKS